MTRSRTFDRALVAGASGETGQELLSVLRPTDLSVRATTRSYANVDMLERHGADDVLVADFFESADAVAAVDDCDIVYCALGTPSGIRHTIGTKLVDRTGVINLITAAVGAGVSYFVLESAIGVGNSKAGLSLPARLLIRGSLSAKQDAETALRRSGLEHTIIRPGRLTNDLPSGAVVVNEGGGSFSGSISRADVARVMAVSPFTPDARNRTLEIVSRDGLTSAPTNPVDIDWAEDHLAIEREHSRI
ncbi:NAD(P)-binding oxidoreductase [Haloarchaeobius amylolyticus]|uniref:NAD(P)-binding oxidoreductase n=1 Tax=Haloarchaeobius amylolyticus TaxID=1198296 RepID=A0ABD6BGM6_9EURY